MSRAILFSSFFLWCFITQGQGVIDSLKQEISQTKNRKDKAALYNALCDELWHEYPQQAVAYADSALELANQGNYIPELIYALSNKGIAEYTLGNYQLAENYYRESIALSDSLGEKTEVKLYLLNLLKKQSKYNEVDHLITQEISSSKGTLKNNLLFLTTAADAYIQIGNGAKTLEFITKIRNHPEFGKDSLHVANVNIVIASFQELRSNYDSAANLLNTSLKVYERIHDNLGASKVLLRLGQVRMNQGRFSESKLLFDEALERYTNAEYPFGIADAKRNLGKIQATVGEYTEAITLMSEALEIFERQENITEMARVYNEIAWIYYYQGSNDLAIEYINKALALGEEMTSRMIISDTYNIYGVVLNKMNKYNEAIEAHKKAYLIRKQLGNKKGMAASLYNIAYVKEGMGEFDQVEEMYIEAYEIEKSIENYFGQAISENSLGSFYIKIGEYAKAEKFLLMAQEKFKELQTVENLIINYFYMAQLKEKEKELEPSIAYYKKHIALKDSLFNERVAIQIADFQARYDLKNKEREIEVLTMEKTLKQKEIDLKERTIYGQRLVIAFAVVGSVLLTILLLVSYRLFKLRDRANKKLQKLNYEIQEKSEEITAQAEELQEANDQIILLNEDLEAQVERRAEELKKAYQELDTFFYRSSHDFRGPLTTFLGLAEVAKITVKDEYSLDLFSKVEATARELDKMVNKLKSISLIGSDTLNMTTIEFEPIINSILTSRERIIKKYNVNVNTKITLDQPFSSYVELIPIVFENILDNALQYRKREEPRVDIRIIQTKAGVQIIVADNGLGFDKKYKDQVLEMYYRASEHSSGNGLGLYLVKKAVDKLQGTIQIESESGSGTKVIVDLPDLGK